MPALQFDWQLHHILLAEVWGAPPNRANIIGRQDPDSSQY